MRAATTRSCLAASPRPCPAPRGARLRSALLLGLLWALVGCGDPPPNLVLISVDTLRSDHVGAYGYQRNTTPVLDELAREGAVFEQMLANSPWTLPSHISLVTGLTPRTHRVVNHRTALSEEVPTLATLVQQAGWRTYAVTNSRNVRPRYGFGNGFDEFRSVPEKEFREEGRRAMPALVKRSLQLLESGEGPFFLFLHCYDVHSDYAPNERFAAEFVRDNGSEFPPTTEALKQVRNGEREMTPADVARTIDFYDAGLREFDADLGKFVAALGKRGLFENTVFMITSDHGEEFLEHGGVLHGREMYDESLRVPLILRGPGVPPGVRVQGWAQLVDVLPTALGLLGQPVPAWAEGIDLGPSLETGSIDADRFVTASADHNNGEDDRKRALVRGDHKLIFDRIDGTRQLYDLRADPLERDDLAARDPERVEAMMALLQRLEVGQMAPEELAPLTDEEREQLKALGYLE